MNKIVILVALSAFFLWLPTAYKRWTHPFRLAKCSLTWPSIPFENRPPSDDVKAILKEPFSYLSQGGQTFVFASRNGRYVLKLLRFERGKLPLSRSIQKWRGKEPMAPRERIERTLFACKIAYEQVPDLTGIVFAHLNPKPSSLPMVRVKDRWGKFYSIDPAKMRFILQRRAEPLLATLARESPVEPLLGAYLALLQELSQRGLANFDPKIEKNFGFLEGKAIVIDFGDLVQDSLRAKSDPSQYARRLLRWLEKRRPEAAMVFKERALV